MKESDIMELIASSAGTLEINPLCYLRRWTTAGDGSKIDKLALEFLDIIGLRRFAVPTVIYSREFAGIKAEIENAIRKKLHDVADYLCEAMQNGYIV